MYDNFDLPGYSGYLNSASVILSDETDPNNGTKREDYWIPTFKTISPLVLSMEDGL